MQGSGRQQDTCWNLGTVGVLEKRYEKMWGAFIKIDGKSKYLGWFRNEIEAAKAYDEAAKKYHKEFANLNFLESI